MWKPIRRGALAVLCGLVWGGCSPSGPAGTDEEKEPQFLIAQSRLGALDFGGAVEAFQLALETNPQSAASHYQLGCLYADKVLDPAAAIYHYEQYLRRKPTARDAELIRRQISGLKERLAKDFLAMPPTSHLQKQNESLTAENRKLHEELDQLRAELAGRAALTNSPPGRVASGRADAAAGGSLAGGRLSLVTPSRSGAARPGTKTHKVKSGDTPSAIARQYHIKVESLLAANPGLNPKRMRIDQNLTIPAR